MACRIMKSISIELNLDSSAFALAGSFEAVKVRYKIRTVVMFRRHRTMYIQAFLEQNRLMLQRERQLDIELDNPAQRSQRDEHLYVTQT